MSFNEVCNCICHSDIGNIKHFMACCNKCKFCQQRIKLLYANEHELKCQSKYDPIINSVRLSELIKALDVLRKADLDLSIVEKQVVALISSVFDQK